MTTSRLFFLFAAVIITSIHAKNIYFDYNSTTFHVCVNAKSGSTSIAFELYEALTQSPYPKSCEEKHQWPQGFSCGFDEIPTFRRHKQLPPKVDYGLLILRNPLHRVLSSWRSKVRPNKCTSSGDKLIDSVERNGFYKQWNTDFVSFSTFVLGKLDQDNIHWNPQFDLCDETSYYNDVVDLEKTTPTSFIPLSQALGVPFIMKHSHHSKKIVDGRKLEAAEKKLKNVLKRIYTFYSEDYKQYGFTSNVIEDTAFLANEFSQYPRKCF